ncbi:hypothetical protein [Nannocystis punicea]|uniref:Uncharacterized protein n=1 Tax=Nannocystis punicea TaxID=2995304 RepID=A0ABY7GVR1_9BACT|nr:hypothetical protein [Nannocystis poenicansa]WAS91058.1 hypothetical protein O0S08_33130 [Nannocystis poenicansa]
MRNRMFSILVLGGLGLMAGGCDESIEAGAVQPRAVTISDDWGVHDPVQFPEVGSCEDYYDTRCADLSPQACALVRARYTCSESKVGVTITDSFAGQAAHAGIWYVVNEDGAGKAAGSAKQACAAVTDKLDRLDCLALVGVAGHEAAVRELAPKGGLAPVLPLSQIDPEELPLPAEDPLVQALDPLGWKVPALGLAAREHLAAGIVIEDVIMLVAPGGASFYSKRGSILVHDARCSMDKVELCLDVDP